MIEGLAKKMDEIVLDAIIQRGIYTELHSELYHGHKQSISRSAIMDFKRNPRKYWARHLNPNRPKEAIKPSWEFGTAFHTLILEPHLFDENYILKPEPMLLKDVGREAYDSYKNVIQYIENSGKIVLSLDKWDSLIKMRDSIYENPRAKELIEGAVYESSYFWKDEESGLMVKSRPDILHSNLYVDLKTIDDASPHNFQREMVKFGYHIQGAMVRDGVKALTGRTINACINICVEKNYPHSIGVYIIDDEAIEAGSIDYKQTLLDLSACLSNNVFPDFEIATIGLPKWAL